MLHLDLAAYPIDKNLAIYFVSDDSNYAREQKVKLANLPKEIESSEAQFKIVDADQNTFISLLKSQSPLNYGLVGANREGIVIWQNWNFNFPDLGSLVKQFVINYAEGKPADDIYKWGNRIEEEGDYLCMDCGYILTVGETSDLRIGHVFPSCEVCQSGEPDSTTPPEVAFWQKL